MIPIKLTLRAFGPFMDKQAIDFNLFNDDKIFLICGKTGSGKTTIFDAITFSLFGSASGSVRDAAAFKSQYSDAETICFTEFVFSVHSKIYTVYREPIQERVKNGKITSNRGSFASLTLPNGDVITGPQEVNAKIEEILGITCDQFKKIVMLPQGEFRKFLSDDSSKKQETLRKLFGTEIYNQFTDKLRKKVSEQKGNISLTQNSINALSKSLMLDTSLDFENDGETAIAIAEKDIADTKENGIAFKEKVSQIKKRLETLNIDSAIEANKNFDLLENLKERQNELSKEKNEYIKLEQKISLLSSFRELILLQSSKAGITERYSLLENDIKTATNTAEAKKRAMYDLEKSLKIAESKKSLLPDINDEINKVLNEIRLLTEIASQKDILKKTNNEKEASTEKIAEYDKLIKASMLISKLGSYKKLLSATENTLLLKKDAAKLQSNYKHCFDMYMQNQTYTLSLKLQEDAPCPVCGSTVHPCKPNKPEDYIEKDKLDTVRAEYDAVIEKLQISIAEQKALSSDLNADGYTAQRIKDDILLLEEKLSDIDKRHILSADEYKQMLEEENITFARLTEQSERISADISKKFLELLHNEDKAGLERKLADLKNQYSDIEDAYAKALSNSNNGKLEYNIALERIAQLEARKQETAAELEKANEAFEKKLQKKSVSEDELEKWAKEYDMLESYKERMSKYTLECTELKTKIEQLTTSLSDKEYKDIEKLEQEREQLNSEYAVANEKLQELAVRYKVNRNGIDNIKSELESYNAQNTKYSELSFLYDVSRGLHSDNINLERYILADYFESVIGKANIRLEIMSDSRYTLERMESKEKGNKSSGLSLQVFDSHTGKSRHVNTLSGGESFIVSLALALGLADIISEMSGGIELDTMFVDEGFGSLDSTSLDYAIECLMSLKKDGRYIGIISHISELYEKIPQKIIISTSGFKSNIEQEFIC